MSSECMVQMLKQSVHVGDDECDEDDENVGQGLGDGDDAGESATAVAFGPDVLPMPCRACVHYMAPMPCMGCVACMPCSAPRPCRA